MAQRTKQKSAQPQTTAQRLASVVKSARDIMRKDKGLNGELDRLPQLTWILFLKLLDDVERVREDEAILEGIEFKPTIKTPYRWRDWAADSEGISGDQLRNFINNDEVTLPDGTRCAGLFAYLRSLQSNTGRERQDVIAKVFKDVNNRMISGALLRDVINKVNDIHFDNSEEVSILSTFYESMLKEMRDTAGDSGEFYTPRPVVRFMVEVLEPQLGETIFDPACGTGGFLVAAYEYLKQKCKPQDWKILQSSIFGGEAKPLPYMLAQMNLLLHGFEYPDIEDKNSLRHTLSELGVKDQVDIILTNPPFGGEEEEKIKKNFPPEMQTSETALLFLQLIMRLLKRHPRPGRTGIVVPNGTLFGDGVCAKVKEKLLTEFNLHTIVRLPNGVFAPYTTIPTNLLFFDASGATEEIWYYELPLPEGRKTYTKTKPLQYEEFADCSAWWKQREENECAWKYNFKEAYDTAITQATPYWDAAKKAEVIANQCAKTIRELDDKIETLQSLLLDFAPQEELALINNQIKALKNERMQIQKEERHQRQIAKDKQSKGDAIYLPIYNLDIKNPNGQQDFKHLPPERLMADILTKDQHVRELMEELAVKLEEVRSLGRQAVDEEEELVPSNLSELTAISGGTLRPLSDLCLQITDGEHNTPPRIPEKDVPLATAKNVRDGYLDLSVTDFVDIHTAQKCWRRCQPQHEDILMVCVGATTGRVCRLVNPPPIVIVRSVALLRPNQSLIEPRFFEYALESSDCQDQIWKSVKQAAQPCLYLNRMKQLSIPVPPLPEQRRIVAYLDNLQNLQGLIDSLKHLRSETITELDALLPSLLDKAFKGEL